MARQQAVAEINAFVKGLITEASPLTFPDNASIDELNLVPQKDGSRKRRLGMNLENNYQQLSTVQAPAGNVAFSSYQWKSPGGYSEKEIAVVQTGTQLVFFDSTMLPLSNNVIGVYNTGSSSDVRVSASSVDGLLIVAAGTPEVAVFDFDGTSLSRTTSRLKIRDMFGVEDIAEGTDLLDGSGITYRPVQQTNAHIYNLRNQTFAYPRRRQTGGPNDTVDPMAAFREIYQVFPANSDSVTPFLYADANNSDDRNTKRFFPGDMFNNPLGTNRAPVGFFIIDALDRGASRIAEWNALNIRNPLLNYPATGLRADRTPGGATVIGTFAGRVFYGGFSSQLIDGDSQSPRMTSYVLFSRLVQGTSDTFKCYQEGDPTSTETPDLVDTDGGFLRIDGAYNIQRLINVGDALLVVAENGVWSVTGGSGYGFKATDYRVDKITEHGSVSPKSIVLLDSTLMYWADDGIYRVAKNQYGDWESQNLSNTTIQSLYDDIPYVDKTRCEGVYDGYTRQVRWLYHNYYGSTESPKELILDVGLGAFYPSEISTILGEFPRVVCMVKVPPFQALLDSFNIVSENGGQVIASDGSPVVLREDSVISSLSEILYVTLTSAVNNEMFFSFSYYRDEEFLDWKSHDGVGRDANAYLITGWTGMGDFQRQKQVPYLTVYSIKTETGFDSDWSPLNSSSIRVQSQWNWTNSSAAGKWSPEFEAYRHKRLWVPEGPGTAFDDGEYVVATKNKLRGRGRVLSLKFFTQPGLDFHLLGWSYLGAINGTV